MCFPFSLETTAAKPRCNFSGGAKEAGGGTRWPYAWTVSLSSRASFSSLFSSCSFSCASITLSARSLSRSLLRGLGKDGFTTWRGRNTHTAVFDLQLPHQRGLGVRGGRGGVTLASSSSASSGVAQAVFTLPLHSVVLISCGEFPLEEVTDNFWNGKSQKPFNISKRETVLLADIETRPQ